MYTVQYMSFLPLLNTGLFLLPHRYIKRAHLQLQDLKSLYDRFFSFEKSFASFEHSHEMLSLLVSIMVIFHSSLSSIYFIIRKSLIYILDQTYSFIPRLNHEIGRASCRERE